MALAPLGAGPAGDAPRRWRGRVEAEAKHALIASPAAAPSTGCWRELESAEALEAGAATEAELLRPCGRGAAAAAEGSGRRRAGGGGLAEWQRPAAAAAASALLVLAGAGLLRRRLQGAAQASGSFGRWAPASKDVADLEVSYSPIQYGTGCSNWDTIQIGGSTTEAGLASCAQRCKQAPAGCKVFNFQPKACGGKEQLGAGSCAIYSDYCKREDNPCWDLYLLDIIQPRTDTPTNVEDAVIDAVPSPRAVSMEREFHGIPCEKLQNDPTLKASVIRVVKQAELAAIHQQFPYPPYTDVTEDDIVVAISGGQAVEDGDGASSALSAAGDAVSVTITINMGPSASDEHVLILENFVEDSDVINSELEKELREDGDIQAASVAQITVGPVSGGSSEGGASSGEEITVGPVSGGSSEGGATSGEEITVGPVSGGSSEGGATSGEEITVGPVSGGSSEGGASSGEEITVGPVSGGSSEGGATSGEEITVGGVSNSSSEGGATSGEEITVGPVSGGSSEGGATSGEEITVGGVSNSSSEGGATSGEEAAADEAAAGETTAAPTAKTSVEPAAEPGADNEAADGPSAATTAQPDAEPVGEPATDELAGDETTAAPTAKPAADTPLDAASTEGTGADVFHGFAAGVLGLEGTGADVFHGFAAGVLGLEANGEEYCVNGSLSAEECERSTCCEWNQTSRKCWSAIRTSICDDMASSTGGSNAGSTTPAPMPAPTPVVPPPVPSGYTLHVNMGIGEGNVISVLKDTTVVQCADACDGLPSCAGFTMSLDSNDCVLMSAVTLANRSNEDAYVKEVALETTPAPTPSDEVAQATVSDEGDPSAPFSTTLMADAVEGQTEVYVLDQSGIVQGDAITFASKSGDSETHTVVGAGSLVLDSGLQRTYPEGTVVLRERRPPPPEGGGTSSWFVWLLVVFLLGVLGGAVFYLYRHGYLNDLPDRARDLARDVKERLSHFFPSLRDQAGPVTRSEMIKAVFHKFDRDEDKLLSSDELHLFASSLEHYAFAGTREEWKEWEQLIIGEKQGVDLKHFHKLVDTKEEKKEEPRCPSGHPMVKITAETACSCDKCKAEVLEGDVLWQSRAGDYDLCVMCAAEPSRPKWYQTDEELHYLVQTHISEGIHRQRLVLDVFHHFDEDCDGILNQEELYSFFRCIPEASPVSQKDWAEYYEKNHGEGNVVDLGEFRKLVDDDSEDALFFLSDHDLEQIALTRHGRASEGGSEHDPAMVREHLVADLFASLDRNHKGSLSSEELLVLARLHMVQCDWTKEWKSIVPHGGHEISREHFSTLVSDPSEKWRHWNLTDEDVRRLTAVLQMPTREHFTVSFPKKHDQILGLVLNPKKPTAETRELQVMAVLSGSLSSDHNKGQAQEHLRIQRSDHIVMVNGLMGSALELQRELMGSDDLEVVFARDPIFIDHIAEKEGVCYVCEETIYYGERLGSGEPRKGEEVFWVCGRCLEDEGIPLSAGQLARARPQAKLHHYDSKARLLVRVLKAQHLPEIPEKGRGLCAGGTSKMPNTFVEVEVKLKGKKEPGWKRLTVAPPEAPPQKKKGKEQERAPNQTAVVEGTSPEFKEEFELVHPEFEDSDQLLYMGCGPVTFVVKHTQGPKKPPLTIGSCVLEAANLAPFGRLPPQLLPLELTGAFVGTSSNARLEVSVTAEWIAGETP